MGGPTVHPCIGINATDRAGRNGAFCRMFFPVMPHKAFATPHAYQSWPTTLTAGLVIILLSELLLAIDVAARGSVIVPYAPLPPPEGAIADLARFIARSMTPLCWTGYLLVADGLFLRLQGWSPIRQRPVRFVLAYLTGIPVWVFFDWVNFWFMQAWDYHELFDNMPLRLLNFFLAFGAISPAMFLVAEGFMRTRLGGIAARPIRFGRRGQAMLVAIGAAFVLFPFVIRDPIGNLTLWLGLSLLLDPINHRLGLPSIFRDWQAGRYGRTLSLLAGGLLCGFLWEFWNYWAVTKWTYHLPFLGPLEQIRYFEMPVPGLLGFMPFAMECWVVFQSIVWLAGRMGLRRIEPLEEDEIL
jgi:hypothetical protein